MKKILLATLEFPPFRGGVAEYLYGLFSALPHDHVAVLADRGEGEPPPTMYPVRRERLLGGAGRPLRWLAAIGPVRRVMREEKAEVLAVSHLLPMGYVAWLFKRFAGAPYVVFVHGTDLNYARRSSWKRLMAKMILRSADLVVANSGYTRTLAIEAGADPKKIEIIRPCPAVGHPALDDKDEAKHDLGVGGKKVMLSVGRLIKRKGFDRSIRALSILRKTCGDAVYLIVGAGPERVALEAQAAKAAVKPHTLFRDDVTREKLHTYFSAADVFVLPARRVSGDVEGFGMALLEASAHGLPVVTTRVGGVPEAVIDGRTGLVLDEAAGDEVLAAAICRLLTDRETASALGENGRRRVREEFNWPRQAAMLLKRLEAV